MAFVNEKLTEKDKEFIASFQFHNPIGMKEELVKIPEKWTVDRNRELYLICLGGQGYRFSDEFPPDYYILIVKNTVIEITVQHNSIGNNTDGIDVTWRITSIFIKNNTNNISNKKIIEYIKEAFIKRASMGGFSLEKNVVNVKFETICIPTGQVSKEVTL